MKTFIDRYILNPKVIFWTFIIANLVPNIILLFTEPLNAAGMVVLMLFPLSLYLILYSMFQRASKLQLFLIPLLILHAFQIVVHHLFGEGVVAADMYLNVLTTSITEASEVLGGIMFSVIFVCIIYLPVIAIAILGTKHKVKLNIRYRKRTFTLGLIFMILTAAISFFAKDINTNTFQFHKEIYPVNLFYNGGYAVKKWRKSNAFQKNSIDFQYKAIKNNHSAKREIYVFVIGETARAENWGIYGYHRDTNPYIKNDTNSVFFLDAITQSNVTHKSVPIMLSTSSAENFDMVYSSKSILTAFSEAGFTTVFLSNQSPNHTLTDYFAQEADHHTYYRSMTSSVNNFDGEMLPEMKQLIESIEGNIFIVLHSYGSHFSYMERYPDEFSQFKPDQITSVNPSAREMMINSYDNSILYTDFFLKNIIDLLNQTDACSAMLYSSDHGEDIMDDRRGRFLHASPIPTFYQLKIPFFIWMSGNYQADFNGKYIAALENKTKPVATNAVFHTLMDMASIESKYINYELSLVDNRFKKAKRMYLDEYDQPVFFYDLNLKKEDREMIKKRNMYY